MNRRYWSVKEAKKPEFSIYKKSTNRPITIFRVCSEEEPKKQSEMLEKINFRSRYTEKRSVADKEKMTWVNLAQESKIQKSLAQESRNRSFIIPKKLKVKNLKKIDTQPNLSIHLPYQLPKKTFIQQILSDCYKGLRDYNEDRVLISSCLKFGQQSEGSLFGVFDGHGGSGVSEYLKKNFTELFLNQLKGKQQEPELALKNTLLEIQEKIMQIGSNMTSGSCALVCFIVQDKYYIANVGDSRALLVRNQDDYEQLTWDHKPNCQRQLERIQKNGGTIYRSSLYDETSGKKVYGPFRVNPGKLSVSRTIGDFPIKKKQLKNIVSCEPQTFTGKLSHGQTILLFSDGAYEKFTNEQISILFSISSQSQSSLSTSTSRSVRSKIKAFMDECIKRKTNDNVSMIVVRIKSASSKACSLDNITCPSL